MNPQEAAQALRPVPPPEELEAIAPWPSFLWLTAPIVLIALALFFWKTKRKKSPARMAPPMAPLDELRVMLTASMESVEDRELTHANVSSFLHRVCCFYHGLAVIPRTTPQLVSMLPQSEVGLSTILQRCDRVKFGRLEPSRDETIALLRDVEHWLGRQTWVPGEHLSGA